MFEQIRQERGQLERFRLLAIGSQIVVRLAIMLIVVPPGQFSKVIKMVRIQTLLRSEYKGLQAIQTTPTHDIQLTSQACTQRPLVSVKPV